MSTTPNPYRSWSALAHALNLPATLPAAATGLMWHEGTGTHVRPITSPTDGSPLGGSRYADDALALQVLAQAHKGFEEWRSWPAPRRGEVVRQIGQAFRQHKAALGALVSWEMGKIYSEGLGEIQEIIDICDFSVGLSRQLYGLTMPSERPGHRLMERWHPLGTVLVISAFNFPAAVWSWNAMLGAVCGNATLWKPSEKTPYTAYACHKVIEPVLKENGVPEGVFSLVFGGADVGRTLAAHPTTALVSATGSVPMGRAVGQTVAARLGKSLLELGGNNGLIITPSADLKLALQAAVFGAVGTTGQRCTTTRRLIVHESLIDKVQSQIASIYGQLTARIGHPLEASTLIGPLIDTAAVEAMQKRLETVRQEGGTVVVPGGPLPTATHPGGCYVAPALVRAGKNLPSLQHETFAPILYLIPYTSFTEAVEILTGVPQGLSSSVFTQDFKEAEYFISELGSDCGIANVNVGTSGAEIGGAFGGEKETGGGRESGSDAWKAYMRRQTITINYSDHLPLAQGVNFDI